MKSITIDTEKYHIRKAKKERLSYNLKEVKYLAFFTILLSIIGVPLLILAINLAMKFQESENLMYSFVFSILLPLFALILPTLVVFALLPNLYISARTAYKDDPATGYDLLSIQKELTERSGIPSGQRPDIYDMMNTNETTYSDFHIIKDSRGKLVERGIMLVDTSSIGDTLTLTKENYRLTFNSETQELTLSQSGSN